MNSTTPSGWLGATALCIAVAMVSALGPMAPAATPIVATPPSCKPLPPIRVTLEAGNSPGTWRVGVEALLAAKIVEVSVRDDRGVSRVVWRGALALGETRTFDARHVLAATATGIYAEAAVLDTPGMVARAAAAIAVANGKPVGPRVMTGAAGRIVADPRSGELVLELPGVTGSGR